MGTGAPQDLQLDPLEWQAVSVALSDASHCGCGTPPENHGWAAALFATLTGIRPRAPLADPRLEAVRLFVCQTRRLRRPPQEQVPRLLDLGFNERQIDALAALSA